MAVVARTIDAPVERVWAVLANGWSYANWVVGSAHVRAVDGNWPEPGSRLHHTSGIWPLVLSDHTAVRDSRPPTLLVMLARLWPLGRGVVTLRLAPAGPERTRVTLREGFDRGPLYWLSARINDLFLHRRNVEALRRLDDLATGGWHARGYGDRRSGRPAPGPDGEPGRGAVYRCDGAGNRRGVIRQLVNGVLAGAAGTTALNAATYLDMATRGRPASHTPEQTVSALAERAGAAVPGEGEARDNRLTGMGALSGTLTGVTVGVGLAAGRALGLRLPAVPGAVVAGLAAMAASDVPMSRLGVTDPGSWSRADWLADLVPHLAYGVVTHAALAALDNAGAAR